MQKEDYKTQFITIIKNKKTFKKKKEDVKQLLLKEFTEYSTKK